LQAVTVDRAAPRRLLPGLVVAGLGASAALALHAFADALNVLTAAVLLGVVVGALHPLPGWALAGTAFARRTLLQVGIVLLGPELWVGQLRELGAPTLVMIGVVVALTFGVTRWLGRLADLPEAMSLFIATGFSICGVSAIVAMSGTRRHDDEGRAVRGTRPRRSARSAPGRLPRRRRHPAAPVGSQGGFGGASVGRRSAVGQQPSAT
jgi:uncharacterized membrane protein YadS